MSGDDAGNIRLIIVLADEAEIDDIVPGIDERGVIDGDGSTLIVAVNRIDDAIDDIAGEAVNPGGRRRRIYLGAVKA